MERVLKMRGRARGGEDCRVVRRMRDAGELTVGRGAQRISGRGLRVNL